MSTPLRPWARGPFELLLHAELHRREGDDFGRRMALISYDNAIETAITIYLLLNPMQRQGRQYQRQQVERWLANYHTKLDFFVAEVRGRGQVVLCEQADIVWYHDVRNDQYHGGKPTIPQLQEIEGIRTAALWIYSVLFDVPDVEPRLQAAYAERLPLDPPQRSKECDQAIDNAYGLCEVAGQVYYSSEALFAIDPVAYSELGSELAAQASEEPAEESIV